MTRLPLPPSASRRAAAVPMSRVATKGIALSARRNAHFGRAEVRAPSCVQWMWYMQPMNDVHLRTFDLNLLLALDALLTERSVTRASARIGITQSAASHALARLRKLTGDELLVRGRDGMVPTVRAEAMGASWRVLAARLQGLSCASWRSGMSPGLTWHRVSSTSFSCRRSRMRKVRASAAARFWKSASSVLRGASIAMLWHERTHSDPARRWLRDVIVTEATKRSRRRPACRRERQGVQSGSAVGRPTCWARP
ncbi:MAG TPA: LysR family transcriptional regulator [Polyangiaceae bacterium]|nr:LysR family transcriptional regulator [Polyangiaceae bacterium]